MMALHMQKCRARQSLLFPPDCLQQLLPVFPMLTARRGAMMLASFFILAGCSAEKTTAPSQGSAASSDLLGGLVGGVVGTLKTVLTPVLGVTRIKPLVADIT